MLLASMINPMAPQRGRWPATARPEARRRLIAVGLAASLLGTVAHASDFLNACMVEIATLPIVPVAWIHGERADAWPARGTILARSDGIPEEAPAFVAEAPSSQDMRASAKDRPEGEYRNPQHQGRPVHARSVAEAAADAPFALLAAAAVPLMPREWAYTEATQGGDAAPDSEREAARADVPSIAPDFARSSVFAGDVEQDVIAAALPPIPLRWLHTDVAGMTTDAATIVEHAPATYVAAADPGCAPLLQQTFNLLQTGEPQSLCRYQGKVLLIVNTASYCGYTNQYEGLEALYRKYKDRGLVVIGFPSNDFGGQEPGSNKEIAEFCRTTYGVQFPQYEKSSVAVSSTLAGNPLYMALAKQTGKAPEWNFHKYVVDRSGAPVASFASATTPDDRALVSLLERLLNEKAAATKG
jgi:glutathione peroxidase